MRQRTSRTVRPSEQKELIGSINYVIDNNQAEVWGHYGMGTAKSPEVKVGRRLFRVTDHNIDDELSQE